MAGRQIRWQSVGRGAAIVAAVIAGIVALPALLGSDRPPPVPSDVGLAPPPASEQLSPVAAPPPSAPPPVREPRKPRRLVKRRAEPKHPRRRAGQRHRRPDHGRQPVQEYIDPPPAPAPVYSPPAYTYVPPRPGEFLFER